VRRGSLLFDECAAVIDEYKMRGARVCVAVRCSVPQCVAVCCNVLQCVAVRCSALQCAMNIECEVRKCVLQCVVVCCSVQQCVAMCRSVQRI